MAQGREQFGTSAAVVMAMAGSAIGLGNIWRFPYMVGEYGGAVFILIYLIAALFLSLPILLSEAIIGKRTQSDTFGALEKLAPGSSLKWLGLLTVISPLIILSYYSVVGGWSIEYFVTSVFKGFTIQSSHSFSEYTGTVWGPLVFHTLFLGLTALIISAGVKSGIEKFNKVSLPILFFLILLIMFYSVSLPGSGAGVRYMLKPDFSQVKPSVIAAAMGQSFFSLSLGVGSILTYASYMKKEENLVKIGAWTTIFDLIFALIAGFAIMPAVFSAGIQPSAGPGLIFETLPYIFARMGEFSPVLSRGVSILFFLTIVIAALTSSISMFEVGVAYLVDEKKYSRKLSVWTILSLTWVVGVLCSLSIGPLSGVKIFGKTIFEFCDYFTSNYLMTFGSLLFVIFVGWVMKKKDVREELGKRSPVSATFYFLIRYVAPLVILVIFFTNLLMK